MKSLWAFQEKLRGLGHYQSEYKSSEDLRLQFRDQLGRLLASRGEQGLKAEERRGGEPVRASVAVTRINLAGRCGKVA